MLNPALGKPHVEAFRPEETFALDAVVPQLEKSVTREQVIAAARDRLERVGVLE